MGGRDVLVGGSIGPLGGPTRELASHDEAAIRAAFREQIDGLLEGGVDLFVIETSSELNHLRLAIDEARRAAADLPIVAEMTFGEELVAADGTTPEDAARALAEAGVDAFGVNCGAGPFGCLEALDRMGGPGPTIARSIMPNAGLPQRVEGRFVYAAGPDYFGAIVPRMLGARRRASSAAAAARRPSTSLRCGARSTPSRRATPDAPGPATGARRPYH